jgi:hypothetical protein
VKNFISAFLLSVLLLSLMCALQDYYATSVSCTDMCQVNKNCSAFSVLRKKWYRAIIAELLPDNQAKVSSSWDSIISVMAVLWHGWFRVQVPREASDFLFSKIVQTSSGGHPTSFSMDNRVLFPGVK